MNVEAALLGELKKGPAAALDLAAVLDAGADQVRYALRVLQADGRVEVVGRDARSRLLYRLLPARVAPPATLREMLAALEAAPWSGAKALGLDPRDLAQLVKFGLAEKEKESLYALTLDGQRVLEALRRERK